MHLYKWASFFSPNHCRTRSPCSGQGGGVMETQVCFGGGGPSPASGLQPAQDWAWGRLGRASGASYRREPGKFRGHGSGPGIKLPGPWTCRGLRKPLLSVPQFPITCEVRRDSTNGFQILWVLCPAAEPFISSRIPVVKYTFALAEMGGKTGDEPASGQPNPHRALFWNPSAWLPCQSPSSDSS